MLREMQKTKWHKNGSAAIPVAEMRGHAASSAKSLRTKELMRQIARERGLKLP